VQRHALETRLKRVDALREMSAELEQGEKRTAVDQSNNFSLPSPSSLLSCHSPSRPSLRYAIISLTNVLVADVSKPDPREHQEIYRRCEGARHSTHVPHAHTAEHGPGVQESTLTRVSSDAKRGITSTG
jgi:hypothetical protein